MNKEDLLELLKECNFEGMTDKHTVLSSEVIKNYLAENTKDLGDEGESTTLLDADGSVLAKTIEEDTFVVYADIQGGLEHIDAVLSLLIKAEEISEDELADINDQLHHVEWDGEGLIYGKDEDGENLFIIKYLDASIVELVEAYF
ncbi:hypothetical protein D3C81_1269910 [compost metagenome]